MSLSKGLRSTDTGGGGLESGWIRYQKGAYATRSMTNVRDFRRESQRCPTWLAGVPPVCRECRKFVENNEVLALLIHCGSTPSSDLVNVEAELYIRMHFHGPH